MDIQWFPGHMARARRLLGDQLRRVDVVLELCDARLPRSSRNPDLSKLSAHKQRVLVLGKADLANAASTKSWLSAFRQEGLLAVPFTAGKGKAKEVLDAIAQATEEQVQRQAARGIRKTVRAMVVGVPNVGKSTLINTLCGSAITQTADRPGVTRAQRWVKVGPYLELLDTPGLLWPKLEDQLAAQRLAYLGTIRDGTLDAETLAEALLRDLMHIAPEATMERFHLDAGWAEAPSLLEAACLGRGWLQKGGIADLDRGAAIVLDEFRGGKLGRLTLELPEAEDSIDVED